MILAPRFIAGSVATSKAISPDRGDRSVQFSRPFGTHRAERRRQPPDESGGYYRRVPSGQAAIVSYAENSSTKLKRRSGY